MGSTPTIGGMNIVLAGDAKTFSAALDAAEKRIAQLQGKTAGFSKSASSGFQSAGRSAQQFGHNSVTSVQAASGALRELNGDITNNIRAVERFLTTIPGVGAAFKAIYPIVGGLAVAGMFYEGIKKANEFIQTLNKMPAAISRGFGDLHSASQASSDAIRVSSDRLEMEIAKLEKKPANGLQLAVDETTASINKMSSALDGAIAKANELIAKNHVGFFGKLLNKEGTDDISKAVTDTNAKVEGIRVSYQGTTADARDRGASAQNLKDINDAMLAHIQDAYAEGEKKLRPLMRSYSDQQEDFRRLMVLSAGTPARRLRSAMGLCWTGKISSGHSARPNAR